MMNVTSQMSDQDFPYLENNKKRFFRVIPQMVSTLRYNLIFGSEKKVDMKGGENFSPIPSKDEIAGKSFIRSTVHYAWPTSSRCLATMSAKNIILSVKYF